MSRAAGVAGPVALGNTLLEPQPRAPRIPGTGDPSRADYERALHVLARFGRVPGVELTNLDFRVLAFLLAQRPGYFAHHKTIAVQLESNATSVGDSLRRLQAAGLVRVVRIAPHQRLPTGNIAHTNVNQYWVNVPRLLFVLGAGDGHALTTPKSVASTPRRLGSSSGRGLRSEQDPPSSPPLVAAGRDPVREAGFACNGLPKAAEGPAPVPVEGSQSIRDRHMGKLGARAAADTAERTALAPTLHSWRKLGLGEADDRSERALLNRLAEGATIQQLEAAVLGAGADDWLRQGRAKVPFAVVFASVASVERFALASETLAAKLEAEAQRNADRRQRLKEQARSAEQSGPPPPEAAAVLARLFNPRNNSAGAPQSDSEVAQRVASQLVAAEGWARREGLPKGGSP